LVRTGRNMAKGTLGNSDGLPDSANKKTVHHEGWRQKRKRPKKIRGGKKGDTKKRGHVGKSHPQRKAASPKLMSTKWGGGCKRVRLICLMVVTRWGERGLKKGEGPFVEAGSR